MKKLIILFSIFFIFNLNALSQFDDIDFLQKQLNEIIQNSTQYEKLTEIQKISFNLLENIYFAYKSNKNQLNLLIKKLKTFLTSIRHTPLTKLSNEDDFLNELKHVFFIPASSLGDEYLKKYNQYFSEE